MGESMKRITKGGIEGNQAGGGGARGAPKKDPASPVNKRYYWIQNITP